MDWAYVVKHWAFTLAISPLVLQIIKEIMPKGIHKVYIAGFHATAEKDTIGILDQLHKILTGLYLPIVRIFRKALPFPGIGVILKVIAKLLQVLISYFI